VEGTGKELEYDVAASYKLDGAFNQSSKLKYGALLDYIASAMIVLEMKERTTTELWRNHALVPIRHISFWNHVLLCNTCRRETGTLFDIDINNSCLTE
jgi:hypothetical protein